MCFFFRTAGKLEDNENFQYPLDRYLGSSLDIMQRQSFVPAPPPSTSSSFLEYDVIDQIDSVMKEAREQLSHFQRRLEQPYKTGEEVQHETDDISDRHMSHRHVQVIVKTLNDLQSESSRLQEDVYRAKGFADDMLTAAKDVFNKRVLDVQNRPKLVIQHVKPPETNKLQKNMRRGCNYQTCRNVSKGEHSQTKKVCCRRCEATPLKTMEDPLTSALQKDLTEARNSMQVAYQAAKDLTVALDSEKYKQTFRKPEPKAENTPMYHCHHSRSSDSISKLLSLNRSQVNVCCHCRTLSVNDEDMVQRKKYTPGCCRAGLIDMQEKWSREEEEQEEEAAQKSSFLTKLTIQELPSLNIRRGLSVQKVPSYELPKPTGEEIPYTPRPNITLIDYSHYDAVKDQHSHWKQGQDICRNNGCSKHVNFTRSSCIKKHNSSGYICTSQPSACVTSHMPCYKDGMEGMPCEKKDSVKSPEVAGQRIEDEKSAEVLEQTSNPDSNVSVFRAGKQTSFLFDLNKGEYLSLQREPAATTDVNTETSSTLIGIQDLAAFVKGSQKNPEDKSQNETEESGKTAEEELESPLAEELELQSENFDSISPLRRSIVNEDLISLFRKLSNDESAKSPWAICMNPFQDQSSSASQLVTKSDPCSHTKVDSSPCTSMSVDDHVQEESKCTSACQKSGPPCSKNKSSEPQTHKGKGVCNRLICQSMMNSINSSPSVGVQTSDKLLTAQTPRRVKPTDSSLQRLQNSIMKSVTEEILQIMMQDTAETNSKVDSMPQMNEQLEYEEDFESEGKSNSEGSSGSKRKSPLLEAGPSRAQAPGHEVSKEYPSSSPETLRSGTPSKECCSKRTCQYYTGRDKAKSKLPHARLKKCSRKCKKMNLGKVPSKLSSGTPPSSPGVALEPCQCSPHAGVKLEPSSSSKDCAACAPATPNNSTQIAIWTASPSHSSSPHKSPVATPRSASVSPRGSKHSTPQRTPSANSPNSMSAQRDVITPPHTPHIQILSPPNPGLLTPALSPVPFKEEFLCMVNTPTSVDQPPLPESIIHTPTIDRSKARRNLEFASDEHHATVEKEDLSEGTDQDVTTISNYQLSLDSPMESLETLSEGELAMKLANTSSCYTQPASSIGEVPACRSIGEVQPEEHWSTGEVAGETRQHRYKLEHQDDSCSIGLVITGNWNLVRDGNEAYLNQSAIGISEDLIESSDTLVDVNMEQSEEETIPTERETWTRHSNDMS